MHNRLIRRSIAGGLLVYGLSACSTIKSWFPDKERDYQFTSEIPELIVPEDLKNKGLASLTTSPSTPASAESETVSGSPEAATSEEGATAAAADEPVQPKPVQQSDETNAEEPKVSTSTSTSVSSLQIDQAKTPATRMVGRALSRQKIEIVERNIEKGYFYVKFDPNAVAAKDESIWDEFTFMFGDDPSQEQEYRVTVHQVGEQLSEVTVQDSTGKTLSNEVANALLKLITDGINQVVNQDKEKDAPEVPVEPNVPENSAPTE